MVTPFMLICSNVPRHSGHAEAPAMDARLPWLTAEKDSMPGVDLRSVAARLARVRLVDRERDLIERLDRISVLEGGLRYAATSAPTMEQAAKLVARLERALPELAHGLRVIADDRPKILGRNLIGRALERVPAPLPLAFSWR